MILFQDTEIFKRGELKFEIFKTFVIVTEHVLVQIKMEVNNLNNSGTEGHTQQGHENLYENLNAI
jgi:hypothetical protein